MKRLEYLNKTFLSKRDGRLKRNKICKVTKGEHDFKVTMPNWIKGLKPKITMDEFYKVKEDSFWQKFHPGQVLLYYQCSCGKKTTKIGIYERN